MKKTLYPFAAALVLLAAASCDKKTIEPSIPDDMKDAISFSMSDGSQAGVATKAGFTAETKIVMRIQSDENVANPAASRYTRTVAKAGTEQTSAGFTYSAVTFSDENGYRRYWDDAFGRNGQLSVYAVAVADKNDDSLLPISILKDGKGDASSTNVKDWGASTDNTLSWSVDLTQTTATIANKDLVYSNNIQATGSKGVYKYDFSAGKYIPDLTTAIGGQNDFTNGRMQFRLNGSVESNSGKFDKGHMNFNHALSRLTVIITPGTGFTAAKDTDFQFTTGTNVTVSGVPVSGTFNVATGAWTGPQTGTITKIAPLENDYADAEGSYQAQFLPGYTFNDGSTTNVLSFTIDGNKYYVDQNMIFDALKAGDLTTASGSVEMEKGKNYKVLITINKTGISNLTATVAKWDDVTAANKDLFNSYVTLSLSTVSGDACENFDLYRLVNLSENPLTDLTTPTADQFVRYLWDGDYTDKVTTSDNSLKKDDDYATSKNWNTTWYWDKNTEFYHFRTVKAGTTVNTTPDKDNFAITSGAVATTDPHWGAPMKAGATLEYNISEGNTTRDGQTCSTEGFSSSIYKAIGSTTGTIALTEIHMMSEIYVTVKTVTGSAAVNLFDADKATDKATKVTLTSFAKIGTVDMGTGFVRPATSYEDQLITIPSETAAADFYKTAPAAETAAVSNNFSWAVVPQALDRGEGAHIGIVIQTPDNNQYYIIKDLSAIKATSVQKDGAAYSDPNQKADGTDDAKITRWYPGHRYYYTFTLSKKGIDNMTCNVSAWDEVKADNWDVNLEN